MDLRFNSRKTCNVFLYVKEPNIYTRIQPFPLGNVFWGLPAVIPSWGTLQSQSKRSERILGITCGDPQWGNLAKPKQTRSAGILF